MSHPESVARRMYDLVEPVGLVPYVADEPNEALMALGLHGYWDTYFAGRAAPFGRDVPSEVIHAVFYNFAEEEVARHIPGVWELTTPEAAIAARERGCVAGLRRFIGDLADGPGVARAADLLTKAATSASSAGRPCTRLCARFRCRTSRWRGCGTRPPSCASIAATAMSSPSWPRASAGSKHMCCRPERSASPTSSTDGPGTCRPSE